MDNIMQSKIQTKPVHVLVTTEDFEIDGYMHIKPGGYQSRISDLLNLRELHYLPITHATYKSTRDRNEAPRSVETMIVRLDTIKMVIPLGMESEDEQDAAATAEPRGLVR